MGRPIICLQEVSLQYDSEQGSVLAVDRVSLEIYSGEFVCIVGPSGCGKSTLLSMLANLITPTGGTILFEDRPLSDVPNLHERVSMVFQEHALFPWLTVQENIEFPMSVRGWDAQRRRQATQRYLDLVALRHFAHMRPGQLSGGMKQRVGIARALALECDVILMDEPFAALDAQTRGVLQEELMALWERERRTVLFVTHSLTEAVFLADRIAVMTAHPGTVKTVLPVPLPRPRDEADMEFVSIERELRELLRAEIQRSVVAHAGEGGQ